MESTGDIFTNNDGLAFEHLFRCNYAGLLAYAFTLVNDDQEAKDLVQNAFLRLWEKRFQLHDSALRQYLFTMVHNEFIDLCRRKKVRNNLLAQIKANALRQLVDYPDNQEQEKMDRLREQIANLPPRCRQILIMNKRDGMKYREIAEELGISIKSVESQMRIAFQRIRENMNRPTAVFMLIIPREAY